jgi:uncharacterized BrkB/YihY/UPF0761 family membrane protein
MAFRDHDSRWAEAAGFVAACGFTNCLVISQTGFEVIDDAASFLWQVGISADVARLGVILSLIAVGPASLLLGILALRDIKRHPAMRGGLGKPTLRD